MNEPCSPPPAMERDRPDVRSEVEAWVRRHQVAAWRYVRLRGCPSDLAHDLVQEALMAAVHKGIVASDDQHAAAWLRRALDNLWLAHLRREGRRCHHLEAAAALRAMAPIAADDGRVFLDALRECLQQLDGRARQLLDLHYVAGASRESIAAAFGMRANGVKAFLRRVREALKHCVQRRHGAADGGVP